MQQPFIIVHGFVQTGNDALDEWNEARGGRFHLIRSL